MKKIVLAAVAAILFVFTTSAIEIVRPAWLKPGDKVAIISPASQPDSAFVYGGAEILREWGLEPVFGKYVIAEHGTFAGTIEERQSDLEWAFKDPSIKAIMCSRGGYGSIQELLKMDMNIIKNNPKWIIGYSDITAVHGDMVSNGVMSIHAHMLEHLNDSKGKDNCSIYLRKLLFGEMPTYKVKPETYNKIGTATGTLVGGNLSLLNSIASSKFNFLNLEGDLILFVEDINENLEHLNRMMYQLIASGVIGRVKGIILGDFRGYKPTKDFDTAEAQFHSILMEYNIPICYKFPTGHTDVNYPLVEGAKVKLTVAADGTTLDFK